jgi:hypothetical protein
MRASFEVQLPSKLLQSLRLHELFCIVVRAHVTETAPRRRVNYIRRFLLLAAPGAEEPRPQFSNNNLASCRSGFVCVSSSTSLLIPAPLLAHAMHLFTLRPLSSGTATYMLHVLLVGYMPSKAIHGTVWTASGPSSRWLRASLFFAVFWENLLAKQAKARSVRGLSLRLFSHVPMGESCGTPFHSETDQGKVSFPHRRPTNMVSSQISSILSGDRVDRLQPLATSRRVWEWKSPQDRD